MKAAEEKKILHLGLKRNLPHINLLWFQTSANVERLNSREAISKVFDKCKEAGITAVVFDLESHGTFAFPTKLGPHLSSHTALDFPADYDMIKTGLEEAHKRRLLFFVSYFGTTKMEGKPKEWQFVYHPDVKKDENELAVNPFLPQVKRFYFSLLREVLNKYEVDGVILDGIRYRGFDNDFSDYSRRSFERLLGRKVKNWPYDIIRFEFELDTTTGKYVPIPIFGPLFKEWCYWRAKTAYDYFVQARRIVKTISRVKKRKIIFADYVGSWYPDYVELGVNWATNKYQPNYEWALPGKYYKTGYAQLLDFLATGLYFPQVTVAEARALGLKEYYSVEGASNIVNEVVMDVTPVIGTLFVLQFENKPEKFKEAILIAKNKTYGVGIFDCVYIEKYNWWHILKDTLKECH